MAKDIVDIAIGEIGYREQGNNKTKYGAWYGMNSAAWCHMFVSWCAAQAAVPVSVVPKTASCSSGMAWFQKKGQFKYKGKYKPKRGDIVYFKSAGASHVGIVEYLSGNTVHTVEGNTSDKVARRSYALNNSRITGYGVPEYNGLNSESGGAAEAKKSSKVELKQLRKTLERKKPVPASMEKQVIQTNKLSCSEAMVMVKNSKTLFEIPAEEGMKIVWERKGMPGKLTFNAMYDADYKVEEGDTVIVSVGGENIFYGFIFQRQMSKDRIISYTAYDQLRYLKNKDTLIYKKKRADQVVRMIAERFGLSCGALANTGYVIPKKCEDNITLFDMVGNALDETLMAKGKVYTLYDKAGKLCLASLADMKVDACLVDGETGEDFTYKTSIDDNVYNQVKLIYENKKKGTYDIYMTKDSKKINKWGVLQYTDKIDTPDVGKLKSQALLRLYGQKQRTLTVSGVIGNKNVRAGSLVPVLLDLSDIKVASYMLVEKVTHVFRNRQYSMDLVLSGGDFVNG